MMYLHGMGVRSNQRLALEYFHIACENGIKESCAVIRYYESVLGKINFGTKKDVRGQSKNKLLIYNDRLL